MPFPSLGFDHREEFFSCLLQVPATTKPVVPIAVDGLPGQLILDGDLARDVLNSPHAHKGRKRHSQAKAGGFSAAAEHEFSVRRRTVMAALAAASADRQGMEKHTATVCARLGGGTLRVLPPVDQRATAFSEAMVNHLLGVDSHLGLPPNLLGDEIQELRHLVEECGTRSGSEPARARRDALADLMGTVPSVFADKLFSAGWSRPDIVDEVLALALAGWESTAAAVTSGFSLNLQPPNADDYIRELLRLYPPSWLLVRTCSIAGGWKFGPEELLIISPWLIHRNESVWKSAEEFIPARFASSTPRPWYLPFGAGPRRCPGERYALAHIKVCLETLVDPDTNCGATNRIALLGSRSSALISKLGTT